ncbi:DnaJ domain-containing protein [Lentinula aciculospora]|uniref:Diphthamide biosynthesis protein 4 n=1 Tax=Lentinula aciculospora TaxID=153920 RepID=A0A9W9DTD3_9AGAR|nr:DnaJ domain-containing protein [Lentinula aciculospora]
MKGRSYGVDFYKVLALSRTASAEEVKSAYHRALIAHHPDKNTSKPPTIHIATIKEAYEVLSSPALRALYDRRHQQKAGATGPRPAQSVSLEEFEEDPIDETVWTYPCRCGARYHITEDDMENGIHIAGCSGCSELVWVGFEPAKDD